MTEAQIKMFQERCNIAEPEDAIHLMRTNDKIRIRNNTLLDGLKMTGAEEAFKTAIDRVGGNKTLDQIRKIKEAVQLMDNNETRGMPFKLRLVVGGKYMITTNIDVAGKICAYHIFLLIPIFFHVQ